MADLTCYAWVTALASRMISLSPWRDPVFWYGQSEVAQVPDIGSKSALRYILAGVLFMLVGVDIAAWAGAASAPI